jgi:hypothetical protein
MHKSALRLELSADPVLNWSVLLVQHIFEAESSIVELCEGEHIRLVDQDKSITHTSIHDITTALFDSYYQRSGKLELTRERKWDDIPKCYYLGFKSGKKLVPVWLGWYEDMLKQWRIFQGRIASGQSIGVSDIPAELLRLNRVLRSRSYIAWRYISIVDFILLPFLQHVVRVLLALPTLHAQIGALTVHVLLWIEQLQQRGEVAQFTVRHGDFKVIDVPALVQSTLRSEWHAFKEKYTTGPEIDLAVSDRRHHLGLNTVVTWPSVITKLGSVVLPYDDDTGGIEEGVRVTSNNRTLACKYTVDWSQQPPELDPSRGLGEHKQRLDRKRDQLTGLVHVIGAMIQPGDVVVDFCAGGGHLTLVLAHLFPHNQFVLLDKNDVSLSLAQKRIRALGLQNIQVMLADVQAVLNGTVSVTCSLGLALHACGALSDLVLDFCLAHNAAYCLVPCCLGAISNWHGGANVHYPRSSLFGNECGITLEDYLLLAARADQTACEADSAAYWLGKHAMGLINYDRNVYAEERGYKTIHLTLKPSNASPKNDIICGTPSGSENRFVNIFL